jgi:quercetin dioxygenase-like cupin family protein
MAIDPRTASTLKLQLEGFVDSEHQLYRQVLFDQVCASIPNAAASQVMVFTAEIAPGGFTNWHCHNGATFFVALQGMFEAHFDDGVLVTARAGDVYSEPVGKFHRGHNPHDALPYLCIGFCITPPDLPHVTNADGPMPGQPDDRFRRPA